MSRSELEGVLAHELSHIHNYDILVGTIAVTLVGFVALLSDFGLRLLLFGGRRRDSEGDAGIYIMAMALVFIVLAPFAAKAMQFAISRRRESLADVSGVLITRNPEGLISALEKLRDNSAVIAHAPAATAHMWIESPLDKQSKGAHGWFNRLFETHPPIETRIAALEEVAGTLPTRGLTSRHGYARREGRACVSSERWALLSARSSTSSYASGRGPLTGRHCHRVGRSAAWVSRGPTPEPGAMLLRTAGKLCTGPLFTGGGRRSTRP